MEIQRTRMMSAELRGDVALLLRVQELDIEARQIQENKDKLPLELQAERQELGAAKTSPRDRQCPSGQEGEPSRLSTASLRPERR